MLLDAHRDERPGLRVAYRTDAHLINQRWRHFHSNASATSVHEHPLVNDCALNATSEGDIQRSMNLVVAACDNFGLVINTEKTVVMYQLPPNTAYITPQINVNGAQLQVVDNFPYMSSTLSRTTKINDEVARRISRVSQVFCRPQNTVRNRHGHHFSTKLKMDMAIIPQTLLYGVETWTVYKKQTRGLNHFQLDCL
ncbi:hypothetical protein SprV_0902755800 [Sparganum proliferum]